MIKNNAERTKNKKDLNDQGESFSLCNTDFQEKKEHDDILT
jgi:hypothetical protein